MTNISDLICTKCPICMSVIHNQTDDVIEPIGDKE